VIERFQRAEGRRRLIEALAGQRIVGGNHSIAEELAEEAVLLEVEAGADIITEGAVDNDVYFLLAGCVAVVDGDRQLAVRHAGQHVGEMALIDPTASRSATVIAREATVLAKVSASTFRRIADRYPYMWRSLAIELGDRLRQRKGT